MNAAEMIEAIRQGAEACERKLGGQTERDLVRALVATLDVCTVCGAPATMGWAAHEGDLRCDTHGQLCSRPLSHAVALRAMTARMRTWGEPAAPVAASDGGRG